MTKRLTQEDKVAKKMIEMVNDLNLDLDETGKVIAHIARTVSYNRLKVVLDSAEYEMKQINKRTNNHLYW
jgi:uncharacterized protein YuzE